MDARAKQVLMIAIVFGIFAVVGLQMGSGDSEQEATYCEMVGLWQQTGGELGWPDYKGNAAQVCALQH